MINRDGSRSSRGRGNGRPGRRCHRRLWCWLGYGRRIAVGIAIDVPLGNHALALLGGELGQAIVLAVVHVVLYWIAAGRRTRVSSNRAPIRGFGFSRRVANLIARSIASTYTNMGRSSIRIASLPRKRMRYDSHLETCGTIPASVQPEQPNLVSLMRQNQPRNSLAPTSCVAVSPRL
jgi:hypothetical protein